jgi:hypothetical protein
VIDISFLPHPSSAIYLPLVYLYDIRYCEVFLLITYSEQDSYEAAQLLSALLVHHKFETNTAGWLDQSNSFRIIRHSNTKLSFLLIRFESHFM